MGGLYNSVKSLCGSSGEKNLGEMKNAKVFGNVWA